MFQKPILVFSEYCDHSREFVSMLVQQPDIYDQFIFLNIDPDPNTNQRPPAFDAIQSSLPIPISEVPTIIVSNGEYVLSGDEAFKWLDFQLRTSKPAEVPEVLVPFNPNEMRSFSDPYAKFGSNQLHDASQQSFRFLGQSDRIVTPDADSMPVNKNVKQETFQNTTRPQTNRAPQDVNFNFGYATTVKPTSAESPRDIEKRYEQLLAERNNIPGAPMRK